MRISYIIILYTNTNRAYSVNQCYTTCAFVSSSSGGDNAVRPSVFHFLFAPWRDYCFWPIARSRVVCDRFLASPTNPTGARKSERRRRPRLRRPSKSTTKCSRTKTTRRWRRRRRRPTRKRRARAACSWAVRYRRARANSRPGTRRSCTNRRTRPRATRWASRPAPTSVWKSWVFFYPRPRTR